jgi:hypothetical protein
VGLNASRNLLNQPSWRNFHYLHRGSKERKLCRVLSGTCYEGSYMTDILRSRARIKCLAFYSYVRPAWGVTRR